MVKLTEYIGKRLHFIGIGGTGMSALARILRQHGYNISGSDKAESPFTRQLVDEGVNVCIGHERKNVEGVDLVIYSAAIKADNPEMQRAKELEIPLMERSIALGQLSEKYKQVIAISGCHGKTTITSMLGLISMCANLNATVHLGGYVDFMEGGVLIGNSDRFITEACEYVESFMYLRPTVALINNIDDDHLDYYKDIEHITQTFVNFAELLPADGTLICNTDDERVSGMFEKFKNKLNCVSYGLFSGMYRAINLTPEGSGIRFDVIKDEKLLFKAKLSVPGSHNVINALAAIVVSLMMEVEPEVIVNALQKYSLTRRRFEYYGSLKNYANVRVYHDYAHHPSEIRACLQGARQVCQGKLYVVFQCNSFTRAKTLFLNNVNCFSEADQVLVPDIFPGREQNDGTVHAKDMVNAINQNSKNAKYIPTFEEISDYLQANAKPQDIVVTLGSGDVYIQTKKLL